MHKCVILCFDIKVHAVGVNESVSANMGSVCHLSNRKADQMIFPIMWCMPGDVPRKQIKAIPLI